MNALTQCSDDEEMAGYGQVSKSRDRDCHLEMETELNALKIREQALCQRAVTQPAHKAAEAPAKILYKNTVREIYALTGEWVTVFKRKISHYFDLSSMQNCRANGKGTELMTFSVPFQQGITEVVSFLLQLRVKNQSSPGEKEASFKTKGTS